jgi:hypothetical protein
VTRSERREHIALTRVRLLRTPTDQSLKNSARRDLSVNDVQLFQLTEQCGDGVFPASDNIPT